MSLNIDWTQCAQQPTDDEFQGELFLTSSFMHLLGIQRLDNVEEFMIRIRIFERFTGDLITIVDGKAIPFPVDTAKKWEGLSANVAPKTRTKFVNDLTKQQVKEITNDTRKEVNQND